LEIFRKFSVAFRGLWQIQNGPGGLLQFKASLARIKAVVEGSRKFSGSSQ